MENQRLLLYFTLFFIVYLLWAEWQMDYGPKPAAAPDTASVATEQQAPSSTETAAAAAAVPSLPAGDGDWSSVNVLDAPGLDSYPIATFTYILVYKELYNDETKMNKTAAKTLLEFIWWAVHDDGQSLASPLQYAQLPAAVVHLNEETLRDITYQGEPLME